MIFFFALCASAVTLLFMSAPKFHPLPVKEVRPETGDCVSVAFDVPAELRETFKFLPGQYVTVRAVLDGQETRRSYSVCVAPEEDELRVAVKKVDGGRFSTWANETLKAGEVLEVMPPMGRFTPKVLRAENDEGKKSKHYLAFAAGSGITPVMSILKSVLLSDEHSRFTLVYGNKTRHSVIFRETIEGLKNRFMERLRVFHVLSREFMDVPLFNGRIDAEKAEQFCGKLVDLSTVDEAFICGPEAMILSVRDKMLQLGLPQDRVHVELFSSPDQPQRQHEKWKSEHATDEGPKSKVFVTLDGATFSLDLAYNSDNILDAALRAGADLPYACKGGVCATCRAKVTEGAVEMEVNYGLEPDEVAKGYVLTCQSHPKTEVVRVDFDAR